MACGLVLAGHFNSWAQAEDVVQVKEHTLFRSLGLTLVEYHYRTAQ